MKKNIFLTTFILPLLTFCGIEVAQPIPRLYAPNGLIVESGRNAAGEPTAQFVLTWQGLNPEEEFSGYNIYYANTRVDAMAYRGKKLLNDKLAFDRLQPTLVVRRPFTVASNFTFVIHKYYYSANEQLFTNNMDYWFFIKAYNLVRNIESPPSLYFEAKFIDNDPS
ncbi:MAG: hypothetical protein ACRCTQ_01655 [Brevinemataceae bacterium]